MCNDVPVRPNSVDSDTLRQGAAWRLWKSCAGMRPWHFAGLLAWVPHFVAVAYAGAQRTHYSHRAQYLSELGERGSTTAAVTNYFGIVPTGLLFIVFGLGVALHHRAQRLLLAAGSLIALHGLCRVLAAVFPCDVGCRPSAPSFSQAVHNFTATTAFVSLTAALFTAAAWMVRRRRGGAVVALSYALGVIAALSQGLLVMHPEGNNVGAYQRVALGALEAWVVVLAVHLASEPRPQPARAGEFNG
jgi:hypothetical membrane protein